MHSFAGPFWSSTGWLDKCTLCGHVVRDRHDQKSNFCSQPPDFITSERFRPVDRALWTGSPSILDPWSLPTPVIELKIQVFRGRLCLDKLLFNGELAFDFPELLQGCTLFCEAEQGAPIPGLPASQTALQGVVVVVVGTRGFLRPCVTLGRFSFLILLHVAHWTGGTRWGAVVDGALWRSSAACSW